MASRLSADERSALVAKVEKFAVQKYGDTARLGMNEVDGSFWIYDPNRPREVLLAAKRLDFLARALGVYSRRTQATRLGVAPSTNGHKRRRFVNVLGLARALRTTKWVLRRAVERGMPTHKSNTPSGRPVRFLIEECREWAVRDGRVIGVKGQGSHAGMARPHEHERTSKGMLRVRGKRRDRLEQVPGAVKLAYAVLAEHHGVPPTQMQRYIAAFVALRKGE